MKALPKYQAGKSYFIFILIAIVAIGSGLLVQNAKQPPIKSPEFKSTILLPTQKDLGDVNFVDHNGQAFGVAQLKGKWSALFFGFTNCPDVCPTTMQMLKQVKQDLRKADVWHNYQVLMVSVDPARDTTERLKSYVPFFDPEFIGLSASVEHTTAFAKNLGVLFFISKQFDNGGYDVDHSAAIILINPEGKYAGVMTAPHTQSNISADLIKLAEYAGTGKPDNANSARQVINSPSPDSIKTPNAPSTNILSLDNAWIRPAPPQAPSMAGYFDFVNNTVDDIVIVGSSSKQFDSTMIHDTVIDDGIVSMEHLDELVIPAMGRVSLTPSAKHLMLMGANTSLNEGDRVDLSFEAQDGSQYHFKVDVKHMPEQ